MQIGQLATLGKIELRAGRAQLIVEVMDARVFLLAHVTMLRLQRLALRGVITVRAMRAHRFGREYIGRGEYRLAAPFTDAGLLQKRVAVEDLRLASRPPGGERKGAVYG